MAWSGARLVEVGTTNRTRRADYVTALADPANDVAVVVQVHQSNFRVVGYTEAPRTAELAELGPPLVADIGSGLLDSRCGWLGGGPPPWLDREPAARQTLEAGAALVMFSGDKLLGGPPGRHHRRAGRSGRGLPPPPAGPSAATRLAGARRAAGHGSGLSARRRRRHRLLAHGRAHPLTVEGSPRRLRRPRRGRHRGHTGRRHAARRRDRVGGCGRVRRPDRGAAVTPRGRSSPG